MLDERGPVRLLIERVRDAPTIVRLFLIQACHACYFDSPVRSDLLTFQLLQRVLDDFLIVESPPAELF